MILAHVRRKNNPPALADFPMKFRGTAFQGLPICERRITMKTKESRPSLREGRVSMKHHSRKKVSMIRQLRAAVLFPLLTCLAGCGGCGKEQAENAEGEPLKIPFAGKTLDVAVPAGLSLPTDWELPVNEWSDLTQADCRLHEYSVPEDSTAFAQVLKKGTFTADSRPQVVLIPWSALPELAAEDGLDEISSELQAPEQLDWLDIFQGLRTRAASVSRKPMLVPISCPTLVCYYRQDLLEKAGLAPPKTWSEYQNLLDTLGDWAPGLSAVEPWGESFRASLFLARSAAVAKHPDQFSFCFNLSTGDPLIANPGFVESLKLAKAALAKMPKKVKTYTPADCRREILEGRAAIAIAYEANRDSTLHRGEDLQIGIGQLPGSTRVYNTSIDEWVDYNESKIHRVTYTGFAGWAFGVSAGLETITNRAAWEFVRYMAVDQLPSSYPAEVVSLCRDSQAKNPSQWTGNQLTTVESEQYASTVAEALRHDQLVMELPVISQSQFRAALTQGLTKAIAEDADEAKILEAVAQEWREIEKKLGKDNVAKSYQRSHGWMVR